MCRNFSIWISNEEFSWDLHSNLNDYELNYEILSDWVQHGDCFAYDSPRPRFVLSIILKLRAFNEWMGLDGFWMQNAWPDSGTANSRFWNQKQREKSCHWQLAASLELVIIHNSTRTRTHSRAPLPIINKKQPPPLVFAIVSRRACLLGENRPFRRRNSNLPERFIMLPGWLWAGRKLESTNTIRTGAGGANNNTFRHWSQAALEIWKFHGRWGRVTLRGCGKFEFWVSGTQ